MSNLVFVRFFPKTGAEEKVRKILQNMVVNTRTEPGCTLYNLYQTTGPSGNSIFCLAERYTGDAGLQAHRDTDYYKDYRANIMDLLDAPIEVNILSAIDEI